MAGLGSVTERTLTVVILAFFMSALISAVNAQAPEPAPSQESDGYAIDQSIAYTLLFLALVVTYLIHPLDAFPSFF